MSEIKLSDLIGSTPMCEVLDIDQVAVNPEDFSPRLKFTATLNVEKLTDAHACGFDKEMFSILGESIIKQINKKISEYGGKHG
jgi:hypothetical protein